MLWKTCKANGLLGKSILNIPVEVEKILNTLEKSGKEAYVVGGCVRDQVLGKQPEDWDITTSATPAQIKQLFLRTIDTGIQHGTVTVLIGKKTYEVTTYRIDGIYQDHRRPSQVQFTSDLVEDLRRRDFTINAMAYHPKKGIIDVFGGLQDLKDRKIRCVGEAKERFSEDALRMLRAIRFAAQLNFTIEEKTKQAIREKVVYLKQISIERIRVELQKLLLSDHPEQIEEACKLGITKQVFQEFDKLFNRTDEWQETLLSVLQIQRQRVIYLFKQEQCERAYVILRFTMLLHRIEGEDAEISAAAAKRILEYFKFDRYTIQEVVQLIAFYQIKIEEDPIQVRKAMATIGVRRIWYLFEVKRAIALARKQDIKKIVHLKKIYCNVLKNGDCVSLKELDVNGSDLIQEGIKPGKQIGKYLQSLLQRVLEHPNWNKKETLLAFVRQWKEEDKRKGDT